MIPKIILDSVDIALCRKYVDAIPYSNKSNVYDSRDNKLHMYNTYTGKYGELATYTYFDMYSDFIYFNDLQVRNWKVNHKRGDGGIDIIGTPFDCKTSVFDRTWKYKYFYVPVGEEYKVWKYYIKPFIYKDDLDNIDINNELPVYIGGFTSGSAFYDGFDTHGKPCKNALLRQMGKIENLKVEDFKKENITLDKFQHLTLSDTDEMFKVLG